MLEKYTRTAKDKSGCEFSYTMCGVYEKSIEGFRKYSEKIYVCEEFPELRAHTLAELKSLVSNK